MARFPPRLLRWAKRLSPRITEAYQYTLNHVLTCQLAAATLLADALAIQKWKVNVDARVCHPFAGEFQNKVAVPEPKKKRVEFHFRSFMKWRRLERARLETMAWELHVLNYKAENEAVCSAPCMLQRRVATATPARGL